MVAEALPPIITSLERAMEGVEALTPPALYAADHERFLAGRQHEIALSRQMLEAADARDFLEVRRLHEERLALARDLAGDLSPSSGRVTSSSAPASAVSRKRKRRT